MNVKKTKSQNKSVNKIIKEVNKILKGSTNFCKNMSGVPTDL